MSTLHNFVKEPLFHVVQRANISSAKAFMIRLLAVILALATGGLFLIILGFNPIEVYKTIISGSIGSNTAFRETVKIAIPLLFSALGVSIAFKMKFWNIGAEGQICIGAIACSYFAYFHSDWSQPVLITVMIITGMIAGGLYGMLPAYFKTKFNTNETLLTLMLNYIAVFIIQFLREGPWHDPKTPGFPIMPRFPKVARMPKIAGIHAGWIVALVFVVLVYIYINYSKHGYEISVVGANPRTAEYAGMPVSKIVMRTMFVSAAICGLAGVFQASGADRQLTETVAGGVGFTAIIVAWLGKLSPPSILVVSVLFAMLTKGSGTIETIFKISSSMADVLQGIIIFFVLGCEFFIKYQLKPRQNIIKGGLKK